MAHPVRLTIGWLCCHSVSNRTSNWQTVRQTNRQTTINKQKYTSRLTSQDFPKLIHHDHSFINLLIRHYVLATYRFSSALFRFQGAPFYADLKFLCWTVSAQNTNVTQTGRQTDRQTHDGSNRQIKFICRLIWVDQLQQKIAWTAESVCHSHSCVRPRARYNRF
jgi:hypothetical protein